MSKYYSFLKFMAAIAMFAIIPPLIYYEVSPSLRLLREMKVGDSEQKLLNVMRDHKHVHLVSVYNHKNYPENYYVKGWEYKKREINNRVYIYAIRDKRVYYYIGHNGSIEYIFIGGS